MYHSLSSQLLKNTLIALKFWYTIFQMRKLKHKVVK